MTIKVTNKGAYCTLTTQLDKLARHNRQGSFRTKERYYEACKRFCAYLADEYHMQKLSNISGKHLVSYVLYLMSPFPESFFRGIRRSEIPSIWTCAGNTGLQCSAGCAYQIVCSQSTCMPVPSAVSHSFR